MIVYEVRASVETGIAQAYREWLAPHIREILGIPGFASAELLVEDTDEGRTVYTVRYHLDSRAALERYLRDHAPRLREEGKARFGERFNATRRVSELVQVFGR
jgi:heme-degrading monooxygenase HmoA